MFITFSQSSKYLKILTHHMTVRILPCLLPLQLIALKELIFQRIAFITFQVILQVKKKIIKRVASLYPIKYTAARDESVPTYLSIYDSFQTLANTFSSVSICSPSTWAQIKGSGGQLL